VKKDLYKYFSLYKELYGEEIYLEINSDDKRSIVMQSELNSYLDSIKDCLKCPLGKSRKNIVLGSGNPNASIVFVGEAPGKEEDLQGLPFVGRSGKLLDKMLKAINLSRNDVYILNVLKCRPPNNRDPLPSEIEECEPYLKKQLELIKPKLIVSLGRISAMTILRTKESLANMRNKIFNYEGIDFLVTYHPAALLRNPNFKKYAWEDFQVIRDKYINA
jgi:DNA polymerase